MSVNETVSGTVPDIGLPVNSVTSGEFDPVTLMKSSAESLPQ
jgi:hypothetical protein